MNNTKTVENSVIDNLTDEQVIEFREAFQAFIKMEMVQSQQKNWEKLCVH